MKISSIEGSFLEIPFKISFSHASATREKSETFITKITSSSGKIGIGESCPRSYVTGENLASCQQFLSAHEAEIKSVTNLKDLRSLTSRWHDVIDKSPSAWCSIELALLDVIAREENKSVEALLGILEVHPNRKYTAVVGISSWWSFLKKVIVYRIFGFSDFKIKLSGILESDQSAIQTLNRFAISSAHIRLDGNNIWPSATRALEYLTALKNQFWAIEEPVAANDFTGLLEIARTLNTKIILDESFLNSESVRQTLSYTHEFIPNIRISKMGGVLRTIEVLEQLEKQNCVWILGSHVGETSLLTRASLLILNKFNKFPPRALEGGFSSHLLTQDPFSPELKLGLGAQIKSNNYNQSLGWGMNFNYRSTT